MKFECAHDALVDVDTLQPNPKNPNAHPARQIELLAKIISYQGQRSPIVVSNRSGFIVKGHGRLDAVKKLGWAQAAVDYQDYESEAQEYADMIADNKIAELAEHDDNAMIDGIKTLGITDFELLGLDGFSLPEVIEPQCDEDEVPEQVDTRCKLGDVWTLGRHRLMCGDSTSIDAVDALMAGEKAEMVFTDPPYGIGFKYNSHQDSTGDEYKDFCRDWFHNLQGRADFIVISTGWAYNGFWYSYEPKDCFYWICKNKRTGGSISHFRKVEPLFIWGKPANRYDFDFFEQTTQIEEELKGKHTCPKPVGLIQAIIAGCSERGSILDVFGGSGTTMIAAEKTGRSSYLLELDPHYCDVILARWEKYTGNKAVLNGPT